MPGVAEKQPVVLHLCGSRVSDYYEGVSIYYASECFKAVSEHGTYHNLVCAVHTDGTWSFPADFSDEARASAERVDTAAAVAHITKLNPAAVVPHMFCAPGMTAFRGLFDVLGIPYVGNAPGAMELTTNKRLSKAVVAAAGVPVPESELLRRGERPTMERPFVLKPCSEDNSQGVSLVREGEDVDAALAEAFSFDHEVLCERFVPLGRELRCAVLERDDGTLEMLPCIEYFLPAQSPIRSAGDKLQTDSRGVPTKPTPVNRQCPADIDGALMQKLEQLVSQSHRALGCRDYSLYDVRVDPRGEPFFIEAGLYCSFAPLSVIVLMANAQGLQQRELFERMVGRAMARRSSQGQGQLLGMKAAF